MPGLHRRVARDRARPTLRDPNRASLARYIRPLNSETSLPAVDRPRCRKTSTPPPPQPRRNLRHRESRWLQFRRADCRSIFLRPVETTAPPAQGDRKNNARPTARVFVSRSNQCATPTQRQAKEPGDRIGRKASDVSKQETVEAAESAANLKTHAVENRDLDKKDKLRKRSDNADFAIMTQARELRLAKRMARLGTETAFEVLVKARALEAKGRDIIHLEIGEPDFDTPINIIDVACDALHKSFTHYGPSAGLPQLREVIAQYVSETRRVNVTPDEVVIVPGGKPIIFFSILALVEEGDEVIYPNPGFPIYESMINYVGAKAVAIRLREDLDFRLDVDELAGLINDRTKLIILNSPQNPTGGVLEKKDIDAIVRAIGDRNIMVLSDEIYSRLIFEGEHHSIMSIDGMKERCILLDGFSKTYAMTGWRMGYGVMRADLATHVARLMTNSNSCTASFTQVAGVEALRGPQKSVDEMRAEFKK